MLVHVIDAADGEPAERWAIDRPRAGRVRRRTRRAAAGRRPEQDRPAVRAARARCRGRADHRGLSRSRRRPARASRSSSARSSSHVPEPEALPEAKPEGLADFLVYRPGPRRRRYRIFRTDTGFRVVGRPPGDEELAEALKAAGAKRATRSRSATRSSSSRDRPPRRHVRPAAQRSCRAGPGGAESGASRPARGAGRRAARASERRRRRRDRLRLAKAAFPDAEVQLDPHPFTVDSVRDGRFGDAAFVVGADQGALVREVEGAEGDPAARQACDRNALRLSGCLTSGATATG